MEPVDTAADEAFLLDLLNSTPIVDGVQHDDLDAARAGRTWLRAHGHLGSTERVAGRPRRPISRAEGGSRAGTGALAGRPARRRQLSPIGVRRRCAVAAGRPGRPAGCGAGGARVGRPAPHPSGTPTALREPRVRAVPDRPQQTEQGPMVLDGGVRESDEGPPPLRTHPRRTLTPYAQVMQDTVARHGAARACDRHWSPRGDVSLADRGGRRRNC